MALVPFIRPNFGGNFQPVPYVGGQADFGDLIGDAMAWYSRANRLRNLFRSLRGNVTQIADRPMMTSSSRSVVPYYLARPSDGGGSYLSRYGGTLSFGYARRRRRPFMRRRRFIRRRRSFRRKFRRY